MKPLNPHTYREDLLDFFVPLSLCYNRFFCTNGGIDTCIFAPNSKNIYQYFKDHGVEVQNLVGARAVRNLGFFWFHLGMLKRNYFVTGKRNHDYISLKDFLKSNFKKLRPKIQTKAFYKDDYDSFWDNLRLNFEKDKKYAQEFLQENQNSIRS